MWMPRTRFVQLTRTVSQTLVLALTILACAPLRSWSAGASGPRLEVSLSRGICARCRIARTLTEVVYADGPQLWAMGYEPPNGDAGAGEYIVLHSADHGRTWRELPWTFSHNEPPLMSFATDGRGWMGVADTLNADLRLEQTETRGRTWRRLPLRDLFIQGFQYVGAGVGFAYADDPYTRLSYVYRTWDGGRRWDKTRLPAGFRVDAMSFADAERGYLAGCISGGLAVLRTTDGGRKWAMTPLAAKAEKRSSGQCERFADGLLTLADGSAWVSISKHLFDAKDDKGVAALWRTTDQGANWSEVYRQESPGKFLLLSGPYRLADMIIVLEEASVIYSRDDGRTWSSLPLKFQVGGCYSQAAALICSAGKPGGFSQAVIKVAADR